MTTKTHQTTNLCLWFLHWTLVCSIFGVSFWLKKQPVRFETGCSWWPPPDFKSWRSNWMHGSSPWCSMPLWRPGPGLERWALGKMDPAWVVRFVRCAMLCGSKIEKTIWQWIMGFQVDLETNDQWTTPRECNLFTSQELTRRGTKLGIAIPLGVPKLHPSHNPACFSMGVTGNDT